MKHLLILTLTAILAACGGSGGDQASSPSAYTPATNPVSQLRLLDAQGTPLANAEVSIDPVSTAPAAVKVFGAAPLLMTDINGNLTLNNLAPGYYTLTITLQGVTVRSRIVIHSGNASGSSTIAAPLVLESGGPVALQDGNGEDLAIFATLSGVIYTSTGPLAGAEVSISGGADTNGAAASDVTDEDGRYLLIVNVSLDKLSAMRQATLRVHKDGYTTLTRTLDITTALAFIGQNVMLSSAVGTPDLVYEDGFNSALSGATCGGWSAAPLTDTFSDEGPMLFASELPAEEPLPDEGSGTTELLNLWHHHGAGQNIINQALDAGLVQLAPDDNSDGRIPQPFAAGACWYGQGGGDAPGTGNFMGQPQEGSGGELNGGGTSVQNHGGALVSPRLDLSNEAAPLAFSFRTWWEIESENPNESGYDLLIVEYSTDDGASWNDLARLNPLTDPESGDIVRFPLPYSNRGFNRAPAWLWQEPIDISVLAGQPNARLRLVFSTEDELYNGFRGWLVDDVRITREAGTFPHYDGSQPDEEPPTDCPAETESCEPPM